MEISRLKIKICGMREPGNIKDVAKLDPDYIGFIFHPRSARFVHDAIAGEINSILDNKIKRVGVFVNADPREIERLVGLFVLNAVQLHGNEKIADCRQVRRAFSELEIWKAFQIDDSFNFDDVLEYQECCDRFIFDSKSVQYGGSGIKFNWERIQSYKGSLTYIIAGGLDADSVPVLKDLAKKDKRLWALDFNSQLEISAGTKSVEKVAKVIKEVRA